jgi:hypothetical protein
VKIWLCTRCAISSSRPDPQGQRVFSLGFQSAKNPS